MSLDSVFSALSDPTRRAILSMLSDGETALSDIAKPFDMSQTGVTRHVNVLHEAGLVTISKRGRVRYCNLVAQPLREASQWLSDYQQFWDANLSNLSGFLVDNE